MNRHVVGISLLAALTAGAQADVAWPQLSWPVTHRFPRVGGDDTVHPVVIEGISYYNRIGAGVNGRCESQRDPASDDDQILHWDPDNNEQVPLGEPNAPCIKTNGPKDDDTEVLGDDKDDVVPGYITTGANGICESITREDGDADDDVQLIASGNGLPNAICIAPGDDGLLGSALPGPEPVQQNLGEQATGNTAFHQGIDVGADWGIVDLQGRQVVIAAADGYYEGRVDPADPYYSGGTLCLDDWYTRIRFLGYTHAGWDSSWGPPPDGHELVGVGSVLGHVFSDHGSGFPHLHFEVQASTNPGLRRYYEPLKYVPRDMWQWATNMPEVVTDGGRVDIVICHDGAETNERRFLRRAARYPGEIDYFRVTEWPIDIVANVRSMTEPRIGQPADALMPYRIRVEIVRAEKRYDRDPNEPVRIVGVHYEYTSPVTSWIACQMDTVLQEGSWEKRSALFAEGTVPYRQFRIVVTNCNPSAPTADLGNITAASDVEAGIGCWRPPISSGSVERAWYEVRISVEDYNGSESVPGVVQILFDPQAAAPASGEGKQGAGNG